MTLKNSLTWCEIDTKALKYNFGQLKKLAQKNTFSLNTRKGKKINKDIHILPVIKADAYGHGMEEVAVLLEKEGVCRLGVSDVNEGITLRKKGIQSSLLLFEATLPSFCSQIIHYKLMPAVCTLEFAQKLNMYAQKINRRVDIHVKIDTGMGRLGVWHEQGFDFISALYKLNHLRITGIFTHFPAADSDSSFTRNQVKNLQRLVMRLDRKGMVIPFIHAANSMGLGAYQTKVLNLSRPGLMLYGLFPSEFLKEKINLKPAMSVYSQIIFIKKVEKGRSISYGRTFLTKRDMTIATVPIGYQDGYVRLFSNKARVLVNGIRCPVIGRVTMDQILVDISKVKNPRIQMVVTILGRQGDQEISADELARWAKTINYEIICNLGNRLPRKYI